MIQTGCRRCVATCIGCSTGSRNPFFDHGEACFWLAWRDGVPVGRISAQINHRHLETHHDETGNFGLLEAINDQAVFAALQRIAENWLRERGMRRILGPYSLSMNDDIGVLVSGFDTPPMVGMPYTPPYYAERLAEEGYVKAKDLHALRVTIADIVNKHIVQLENVTARLRAEGRLGVRHLDPARFAEEMRLALDIYNEAWTQNWGFLPVTEREAKQIIDQLAPVLPPQGVVFALADGEPAAMVVALPNLNEIIADLGRQTVSDQLAQIVVAVAFPQTESGAGDSDRGAAAVSQIGIEHGPGHH